MLNLNNRQLHGLGPAAKSAHPQIKRHHVALALVTVASGAALLAATNDNRTCIAKQQRIMLAGPYYDVPDRAEFAAERWCGQHGGQTGPGFAR